MRSLSLSIYIYIYIYTYLYMYTHMTNHYYRAPGGEGPEGRSGRLSGGWPQIEGRLGTGGKGQVLGQIRAGSAASGRRPYHHDDTTS